MPTAKKMIYVTFLAEERGGGQAAGTKIWDISSFTTKKPWFFWDLN